MNSLDPVWITNILMAVLTYLGRKGLKDLEDLRILVAREYATKEEAKEFARSVVASHQSDMYDRWAAHFFTRVEGEALEETVKSGCGGCKK